MHPTRIRPEQSPRSVQPEPRRAITSLLAGCLMLAGFVLGADDMLAQTTPSGPRCEQVDGDDIWVIGADGDDARNLTNDRANDFAPSWSPDGSQIAFSTGRDCNQEIYVMNADGSEPRNITNTPGSDEVVPVWSPDGDRILYSLRDAEAPDVYAMDLDGGNRVNLTNDPATDWTPSWSLDGERIAFASNRDGSFEIYIMDADGRDLERLTDSPSDKFFPVWSPAGDRLAYLTREGGIRIVTADGSGDVEVLDESALAYDVSWSPTGDHLSFSNNIDRNKEIHIVNVDGSNLVNVTNHPADDAFPVWSPDGTRIAFASNRYSPDTGSAPPVAEATDPEAVVELPSCASRIEVVEMAWDLRSDCRTDRTVRLQEGRTFNGNGHTIWVVEPESGAFTGSVIERVGGTANVTNVTISGAALTEPCGEDRWLAGIRFDGVTGSISDVTIDELTRRPEPGCGAGILVQGTADNGAGERATTVVENNTIRGVGFVGIFARDSIDATITGNTVTDAAHRGIVFLGPEATGTASGNTVESVGNVGIAAEGSANVLIADNTVSNATIAGIVAQGGASAARIEGNRVGGEQYGIYFEGAGTEGAVIGNEVIGTRFDAITVLRGAEAIVAENDIFDVQGYGVSARSDAVIKATNNRISRAEVGLMVERSVAETHLQSNVLTDISRVGITIREVEEVMVSGNQLTDIGTFGLLIDRSGEATVSRNEITRTGNVSIYVDDVRTGTITDNVITDAEGVLISDEGTTWLVTGNSIVRPTWWGIGIVDGAEATISKNTIEDAGSDGVLVKDPATQVAITENTVSRALGTGINVTGARADVNDNTVTAPRPQAPATAAPERHPRAGVAFRDGATGSIVGNTISGYVAGSASDGCGIHIGAGAGQIDVGDNQFPAPANDTNVCDEQNGNGTPPAIPVSR